MRQKQIQMTTERTNYSAFTIHHLHMQNRDGETHLSALECEAEAPLVETTENLFALSYVMCLMLSLSVYLPLVFQFSISPRAQSNIYSKSKSVHKHS